MNPLQPYYGNFHQKPRLSQVFLKNYSAVSEVFDNLDLKGKTILEIGAGKGVLTERLAKGAKKIIALEIDPELCDAMRDRLRKFKNVEIVCADALQASLDYPVIIGFLPYHISSPLLFRILSSNFQEALLCLQKEFAERLVAEPGVSDYSKLSVMAQSKAEIDYLATVSRSAFSPVPKVDSALVYMRKREKFNMNAELITALFQHKNQSVKNALLHSATSLKLNKNQLKTFFPTIPYDRKVRTLSLEELEALSLRYEAFFRMKR